MKRTWTIIGVGDVAGSCRWYQSLFGQPATPPGHDDFGQILDADGTVLLCLHQWGAHEHPSLTSANQAAPGNGLLLFFRVDDYDQALARARALVARFDEEPHLNSHTQTREFSLRDPDGYYVTISELPAPEPIARIRQAVAARMASFEAAERALDADALLAHFSSGDGFYLYNDGQRITYDAMAAGVRQAFPTLSRLDGGFTDQEIHILSGEAALVTAQFREQITTRDGAVVRQRGVASWLWRLEDGQWTIALGQVDHYPENVPPATPG